MNHCAVTEKDPTTTYSRTDSVSIAILGSGGDGVMTAGNLLLEAAGGAGWYGVMTRSTGPQIRGGEGAAMMRLSPRPVHAHKHRFDVVVAIGWNSADRFLSEIGLDENSLLIGDAGKEIPEAFVATGAQRLALPITATAKRIKGGRPNMVALGLLGRYIGLPAAALSKVLRKSLARKGDAAIAASEEGVAAGALQAAELPLGPTLEIDREREMRRWNITGNEAAGLGAIRGGVRFVAGYPITPATEILEWLAPALQKCGGVLVQAEDELASVNQLVGASFGGVPSLTATSGPGLALMVESLGLAVASETPLVIVNVMRGGPSTGIPTKSEQSDLNIALYGLHGDAPHLVLAPRSVGDCVFTTQWATYLAERLQSVAIVLSDQALGQTRAIIDRPAHIELPTDARLRAESNTDYKRYADAADGVSPMAIPGTPECQYTADGLTHTPTGTPSSRAEDHRTQLDKRRRKLDNFDFGDHWAQRDGDGPVAVLTWGSCFAPVCEAVSQLTEEEPGVRIIAPRLLLPVQPARMSAALSGVRRILVVEQTHGAQFYRFLRAFYDLPGELRSFAKPGPLQIRPRDILHALRSWENET